MDTFLNMLKNAEKTIKKTYPDAHFLSFEHNYLVADTPYLFRFQIPDGSATLKFSGNDFVLPPEKHDPILGIRVIDNIGRLIALEDAQKQVPFTPENVALYWALYPGVEEPQFAFQNKDTTMFVGAYNGKLHAQKVTIPLATTAKKA